MTETSVAQLFIHGDRSPREDEGQPVPMIAVSEVEAIEGRGIRQDARYFRPVYEGRERKRQVSLIDEATIERHEATFGPIQRSHVKSQIILAGEVFLPALIGRVLRFDSGAELLIALEREPCFQMDFIHPGLRLAMKNGQQGALAIVSVNGRIAVGQRVSVGEPENVDMVRAG